MHKLSPCAKLSSGALEVIVYNYNDQERLPESIFGDPTPVHPGNNISPRYICSSTSADERLKIERFINKSRRLGSLPANQPTMETMADEADRRLLRAIVTCNNHVL